MHIVGALNYYGGAWACFELTFSLLALACQKTHAKLLLVYFFSQSQFCKTEGTNIEYTAGFLYFTDNSIKFQLSFSRDKLIQIDLNKNQ